MVVAPIEAEHLAAWLLQQTQGMGAHISGPFGGKVGTTPKDEPESIRRWQFYSLQLQCYSRKTLTNNSLVPSPLGFYGRWPLFPGGVGRSAPRPTWDHSQHKQRVSASGRAGLPSWRSRAANRHGPEALEELYEIGVGQLSGLVKCGPVVCEVNLLRRGGAEPPARRQGLPCC